jgi:hypothetical protein
LKLCIQHKSSLYGAVQVLCNNITPHQLYSFMA